MGLSLGQSIGRVEVAARSVCGTETVPTGVLDKEGACSVTGPGSQALMEGLGDP